MKIRTKTILIFSSACLVLAAIYFFVIHELQVFEGSSQKAVASEKIAELLAETRTGREALLRENDLSEISYVENEIAGLIAYTETVSPLFPGKENQQLIQNILQTLAIHGKSLEDLRLALSEKKVLGQKLEKNAAVLEELAEETWHVLQENSSVQNIGSVQAAGGTEELAKQVLTEQDSQDKESQELVKKGKRGQLNNLLTDILRKWDNSELNESAENYLKTLTEYEEAEEDLLVDTKNFLQTEETLRTYTAALRANTRDAHESQKRRLTTAIAVAFLLSTAAALIIPLWLLNIIIRPLDQLRRALLAVGAGDLNASIDVYSKDEVGDLADSFRKMTAKLKESYDNLFQANQKLAQMTDNFRNLALLDALTGLYNRRGFDMFLEQQASLAARSQKPFLLLLADMDGLKQINDSMGHLEGDQVIRLTASALKDSFRHTDIVSRIGGDEFAVIAIDSEESQAKEFIRHITEKLRELSRKNGNFNISLSMGYACFNPKSPLKLDMLINKADEMLYTQKKSKPQHTLSKSSTP